MACQKWHRLLVDERERERDFFMSRLSSVLIIDSCLVLRWSYQIGGTLSKKAQISVTLGDAHTRGILEKRWAEAMKNGRDINSRLWLLGLSSPIFFAFLHYSRPLILIFLLLYSPRPLVLYFFSSLGTHQTSHLPLITIYHLLSLRWSQSTIRQY